VTVLTGLIAPGFPRPTENNSRPAIGPLFRSAVRTAGKRVIGAVQSGHLDDGTAGLLCIKQYGGIAVIQAPQTARLGDRTDGATR